MLTSGQPCNFFDKNQNFYGSSYIYKVSYPLHNFFLKKLAQANLDTMVKYPPPLPLSPSPFPRPGSFFYQLLIFSVFCINLCDTLRRLDLAENAKIREN